MPRVSFPKLSVSCEKLLKSMNEPFLQQVMPVAFITDEKVREGWNKLQTCRKDREEEPRMLTAQVMATQKKNDELDLLERQVRLLNASIDDLELGEEVRRTLGLINPYGNQPARATKEDGGDQEANEAAAGVSPAEAAGDQEGEPETEPEESSPGDGEGSTSGSSGGKRSSKTEANVRTNMGILFNNLEHLEQVYQDALASEGWTTERLDILRAQYKQYTEKCDEQDRRVREYKALWDRINEGETQLQKWYVRVTDKLRRYAEDFPDSKRIKQAAKAVSNL